MSATHAVPDPGLAYLDEPFLESDDGRPLRILAEYRESPGEAFSALRDDLAKELERETPAFAKSVRSCCEPGRPCGRHSSDCHARADAQDEQPRTFSRSDGGRR